LWHFIYVLFATVLLLRVTIDTQQFHDYFDAKVTGVRIATDGAPTLSYTFVIIA